MAFSLTKEFILSIIDRFPNKTCFPVFVETGTNYGATIFEMEKVFDKLYTIELGKEFYDYCKDKYTGNKIKFLLGDSLFVLPELIDMLEWDNVVFYLDAHWSCFNTAKGEKEVPLLEEVKSINEIRGSVIIVIDDYRLFGVSEENCNWLEITDESVLAAVDKERIIGSFVEDDRLIIYLDRV